MINWHVVCVQNIIIVGVFEEGLLSDSQEFARKFARVTGEETTVDLVSRDADDPPNVGWLGRPFLDKFQEKVVA